LSFTQTRDANKASIERAEWDAGPTNATLKDGLLLRYDTDTVNGENLAHARREGDDQKGASCRGSNTKNLIKSDMYSTFSKYFKNPKVAFTNCYCGSGSSPTPETLPATEFKSTDAEVRVKSNVVDLSKGFIEQAAIATSISSTQNFTYTLKPTSNTLVLYGFNPKLELVSFMAEFESGVTCHCK
jgi:hypothetical protein